jgi:hypothetical protein
MLLYIFHFLFFSIDDFPIGFYLDWNISMKSSVFLGFIYGASNHTRNMDSDAWVIYSPERQLMELIHTHLGFIFPKIFPCLLVIISHYPVSYILGENIPPGEYSLSLDTSVSLVELSLEVALVLSP